MFAGVPVISNPCPVPSELEVHPDTSAAFAGLLVSTAVVARLLSMVQPVSVAPLVVILSVRRKVQFSAVVAGCRLNRPTSVNVQPVQSTFASLVIVKFPRATVPSDCHETEVQLTTLLELRT